MSFAQIGEDLRATAAAAHAQYPQYKGHWDGWVVAQIKRQIRTKAGVAFTKGEWVLAKPEIREGKQLDGSTYRSVTCYSVSNKMDTSVPAKDVHFPGGPFPVVQVDY